MKQVILGMLVATILAGCYATTPLLVAGIAGLGVMEVKSEIIEKVKLCTAEESDLIKPSITAISEGKTKQVAKTYLEIYEDKANTDQIRAESLYQLGLVYMNRFNNDRDDKKAESYLNQVLTEFPDLSLCGDIKDRISLIEKRRMSEQAYQEEKARIAKQKIAEKALMCTFVEDDLLDLSVQAISERKTTAITKVYLDIYKDANNSNNERATALYQVGLIYMNEFNRDRDDQKAIYYFDKIVKEFPNARICGDVIEKTQTIQAR